MVYIYTYINIKDNVYIYNMILIWYIYFYINSNILYIYHDIINVLDIPIPIHWYHACNMIIHSPETRNGRIVIRIFPLAIPITSSRRDGRPEVTIIHPDIMGHARRVSMDLNGISVLINELIQMKMLLIVNGI